MTTLHNHTEYSILDGFSSIDRMMGHCARSGHSYCSMTDHGNLAGAVSLYRSGVKHGVKPIIGFEAYMAVDHRDRTDRTTYHITLLAKDFKGYQNLSKLSTISYTDGVYYKPRIDRSLLEQYKEGVIVLSGCLAGELQQQILAGDIDTARETVRWYHSVFGEDYYIELQNHGIPEQQVVNPVLVALAKEFGIGMVATNDSHYTEKSDAVPHETLLAIQTRAKLSDEDRFRFPSDEFYIKSRADLELFLPSSQYGDEIYTNSDVIAAKCNVDLPIGKNRVYQMPIVPRPAQRLKNDALVGFSRLYSKDDKVAKERLAYELKVITQMGFADYFLIVAEYIMWAKNNGIAVGPGRGSGVGSIVAYCLGITAICPLKYNLLFERFLNPDRVSLPDFDSDISDSGRAKVLQHVIDLYGEDKVAQISTFGSLGSRAAIKDVGRAMGIDFTQLNNLSALVSVKFGKAEDLSSAMLKQDFIDMIDASQLLRDVCNQAISLEGVIRNIGVHASGIVIGRDTLSNLIPLRKVKGHDLLVSQYDMKDVEDIGLVKMDFLGLRTLSLIEEIEARLGRRTDMGELDDPKVYELLGTGHLGGVFQLEAGGISKAAALLKPRRFEDIIALVSLYRPGPMENIPTYVARHHGEEVVEYDYPMLEPILKDTYGIIVYQEQIMQIASLAAGYTLAEADLFRRAIGKKDHKEMEQQRATFVAGMARKYPDYDGSKLFDLLERFANYGFNKCAHAQTRVMLADGSQISLSRAYREQPSELMAMWSDGTVKPHAVSKIVKTGVKELLKIRTKSGRVIKVTPEHRLLTTRGYIEAGEMTLSDELITLPRVNDKQRAARRASMTKLNQSVTQRKKVSERMIRYQAGRSMEDKVSHMRHMHMIHPDLTRNGVAAMHERIKFLWANDPEFRKRHIERSIASVRDCYNTGPGYGHCSIASNGMWCASSYEREMCEWLISHGVEFEMHKVLRNGRMCDFYFDGLYWEMDGMDRTYQYFADKYGDLPFIVVTPEDYKAIVAKHIGLEHTENGDPIVSIAPCESAMTYDIEMMPNGPLNYIANGIVSHNSHAAAYSLITYITAYYKAHYPLIFLSALLTIEGQNQDKISEYIVDARRLGISIKAPDINQSEAEFTISSNTIWFGLSAISSLGDNAINSILEERKNGTYGSFWDFCQRVPKGKVNSKALKMLILSGAMDSLGDRAQLLASIEIMRKAPPKRWKGEQPYRAELASEYQPYTAIEKLDLERESLGVYVSSHPVEQYPIIHKSRSVPIDTIDEWVTTQPVSYRGVRCLIAGIVRDIRRITTKKGDPMCILRVEDETGSTEVVVFPDCYKRVSSRITLNSPALIIVDIKNGSKIADNVVSQDQVQNLPMKVRVEIDLDLCSLEMLDLLPIDEYGDEMEVIITKGGRSVSAPTGRTRIAREGLPVGPTYSYEYDGSVLLAYLRSYALQ